MPTALFFCSFNPVHVGHLIIADYFAGALGETWMVLTPHNPHKERKSLADDYDRLALLEAGIGDNPRVRASKIEFDLPRPSYTVDTLAVLRERYPQRTFSLVMGSDNLASLPRWKNPDEILRHHEIHVYVRPGLDPAGTYAAHPRVILHREAPLMHISSSYVRARVGAGKSVRYLVPEGVREELEAKGLYR